VATVGKYIMGYIDFWRVVEWVSKGLKRSTSKACGQKTGRASQQDKKSYSTFISPRASEVAILASDIIDANAGHLEEQRLLHIGTQERSEQA